MYLIAKDKAGYQAIPIKPGDSWEFSKLLAGNREVRIILRVRGRRYRLYSTRDLTAKYTRLTREQLIPMCDDIIASVSECIANQESYIDFVRITAATECRYHARWRDKGLIAPIPMERYYGHTVDSKTEQLISYVRVDMDDLVVMDHEPPVDVDIEQEDLPY